MNPFLVFLLGFLLSVAVAVVLYFTVLKKKICTGDLHHCPSADVDICVKSGTSDKDWQKMCADIKPSGGFGANLKANLCTAYLGACQSGPYGCNGSNQACVDAIYNSTDDICVESVQLCNDKDLSKKDCADYLCNI